MKRPIMRYVFQFIVAITLPLWLAVALLVVVGALLWFAAGEVLEGITETPR